MRLQPLAAAPPPVDEFWPSTEELLVVVAGFRAEGRELPEEVALAYETYLANELP